MNILSYNIIGYGSSLKRKSLVQLIKKEDFDVCFIQETKAKVIDENLVVSMWGNKDVEWSFKGGNGRSGGLLIMWKKRLFNIFLALLLRVLLASK